MQTIIKPQYNEEYRACEFLRPDGRGQLAAGEIIVSAEIVITDIRGADKTADMTTEISHDSTKVIYKLLGGTAGNQYTLRIRVATSSAQLLEEAFTLKVI